MSFQVRPVRSETKKRHSAVGRIVRSFVSFFESLGVVWARMKDREHQEKESDKRIGRLKRAMVILSAGLLALLLLAASAKVLVVLKEFSLAHIGMAGAEVPRDSHGLINFVLLGEGGEDHDGIDLTDTIMVASIDPSDTNGAVLFSLPRDLYVLSSEKMGKGRINSLYRNYKGALMGQGKTKEEASRESLEQLGKELGTILGLEIHGVVKVNFEGFVQAVDAIGGVDIEVPVDIEDTQYPGPNYTYETFSLGKGMQHLDGATALKYARSRHSTSDFSRSARQQQIISAIAKRVQDTGLASKISKISQLFSILAKNVDTTLSSRQLITLASIGKSLDRTKIVSIQLNDQNGLYGTLIEPGGFLYSPPRDQFEGAFVLLPVSIPEFPVTWKQIHLFADLLFYHRTFFFEPRASIMVFNASSKEGLARKLGGELFRYNFPVDDTGNFPKDAAKPDHSYIGLRPAAGDTQDEAAARRSESAKGLAEFLSATLHMPVEPMPTDVQGATTADIAIAVTKDYTYTPLQDLLPPR